MEDSGPDLELVKAFSQRAELDLKDAQILLENKDYSAASYFAQQSSEKIVKCVLILNNKFERTHYVSKLLAELTAGMEGVWKKRLEDLVPDMDDLEESAAVSRYPEPRGNKVWNPLIEYTEDDAKEAIEKARKIYAEIKLFLADVHKFH